MPANVVANIDWKNKSFKGKETHNTNSILIQQLPYSSHPTTGLNIIPDYNFNRSQHRSFKGFKTQLPNIHFVRSECKQLPYQEEKEKKEYSNSTLTNFIWLLARLSSSSSGVQDIPSWSGFQRLLHHRHQVPKATIGYLQPITAPPTDINVMFAVINRSLDIIKELHIPHLCLEVDQAIYTKVLDVMFRISFDGKQILIKLFLEWVVFMYCCVCHAPYLADSKIQVCILCSLHNCSYVIL